MPVLLWLQAGAIPQLRALLPDADVRCAAGLAAHGFAAATALLLQPSSSAADLLAVCEVRCDVC